MVEGLILLENIGMKDMITGLIECGYDFDMAVTLSENYQYDFSPILHERGQDVEEVQSESMWQECR